MSDTTCANIKLLRLIECPACLEYMEVSILLCRNGHSVCGKCRKALRTCPICRANFSTIRNYLAESLIENMDYPCIHAPAGCPAFMPKSEKTHHELNCLFRTFQCQIKSDLGVECNWKGLACDIRAHTEAEHSGCSWMQEDNLDRWQPGREEDNEVQLVCAYNELFYMTRYSKNGILYWFLNFIGPDECAKNYTLEIEFNMNPKSTHFLNMRDKCHTASTPATQLIQDGPCMGAPIKFLRSFKTEFRGIWYMVKICKDEELSSPKMEATDAKEEPS